MMSSSKKIILQKEGSLYGIERRVLETIWTCGQVPIVSLTLGGIVSLRAAYPEIKMCTVFFTVRNEQEIVLRIKKARPETTDEEIEQRLVEARKEFNLWNTCCDNAIVGDAGQLNEQFHKAAVIVRDYLYSDI